MGVDEYLIASLERIPNLEGIFLSDRDGCVLSKALKRDCDHKELQQSLFSCFPAANDQAGKLELGGNDMITLLFESVAIVQVSCSPLVLTLLGNLQSNMGALQSHASELRQIIEPFRKAVAEEATLQ